MDQQKLSPTPKVTFIGAPFCEGQNLAGADLAPTALREAGLGRAVESLGWAFEDRGDLDFAAHFEGCGLASKRGKSHLDNVRLYHQWLAEDGAETNFSTWAGRKRRLSAEAPPPPPSPDRHEAPAPPDRPPVVNARRMGSGLQLVHESVLRSASAGHFTLLCGGDHSVASGSISALCAAHPGLGVIWIDAHADANTPKSSPSGHYHGMPAAHLMGWFGQPPAKPLPGAAAEPPAPALPGFEWFPAGCLPETRLAYIGLRDVDSEEGAMVRASAVTAFTMRDVDKHGIATVVERAVAAVSGPHGDAPLHLSLDIDGVDPHFAPGTGTCARGGLTYREVHYICEEVSLTRRCVSMDLVEINPALDPPAPKGAAMHGDDPTLAPTTSPTVRLGVELILSALGKQIIGNVPPEENEALAAARGRAAAAPKP